MTNRLRKFLADHNINSLEDLEKTISAIDKVGLKELISMMEPEFLVQVLPGCPEPGCEFCKAAMERIHQSHSLN